MNSIPFFENLVPSSIFYFLCKNLVLSVIFSLLCLSCLSYYGLFLFSIVVSFNTPTSPNFIIPETLQLSSALTSLTKSPSFSHVSQIHPSLKVIILVFSFSPKKLFLPLNPASVFDAYYHSVFSHIIHHTSA